MYRLFSGVFGQNEIYGKMLLLRFLQFCIIKRKQRPF